MRGKFSINVPAVLFEQGLHGRVTAQMGQQPHLYLRVIGRDQAASWSRLKGIAHIDFDAYCRVGYGGLGNGR